KVDTKTHQIVATISLMDVTHDVAVTPDGRYLYVSLRNLNKIAVISTAEDRLVTTIPQGRKPDLVLMDPIGNVAYATNRHSGIVSVIDLRTHTVTGKISVGSNPHGMALQP
ncbi:MAG TPA: beta-propeller fold lactonase family protein, partial [Candidatus Methylomirabilis sp.]|nr:beta-propeller fold lactonase family protein [Candidatus Methylomirabilis sp.]